MDYNEILKQTINSFDEGDRFVTDAKRVKYIREDIVLKAMENSFQTIEVLPQSVQEALNSGDGVYHP